MSKPKLLVLHGQVNFLLDTYAESPQIREAFDVSKSTAVRGKPDIIFCQSFGQCADQLLSSKRPYVVHVGGNPWLELEPLRLKKIMKVFRKARMILCPSKFLENEFRTKGKLTKNVRRYPAGLWGIDHTFTGAVPRRFKPKSDWRMGRLPRIIMGINLKNSPITERKWRGIPMFLNAAKDLLDKHNFKAVCFGRGKIYPSMLPWGKDPRFKFVKSHHLDSDVDRWPGRLRDADIFVHPSTYDVWGRSVADAMCAAVPSLVFDVTAPPEVGRSTVKCNPSNPADIHAKLERLILDEKYRKELGIAHRKEATTLTKKHRNDLRNFLLKALEV